MERRVLSSVLALSLLLCILLSGCNQTQYTVQFDGNYPGSEKMAAITVRHGSKIEGITVPERQGYVFLGWFADAGLTRAWDMGKDKVQSNMTLYAAWDKDTGDNFAYPTDDMDFSTLRTPGSQEAAYGYKTFFLPQKDGTRQPYVGDPMP